MDDSISRQTILKWIDDCLNHSDKLWEYEEKALIGVKQYIKHLPSIKSESKWIPCSERLPENDKRVLATTAWGEVTIAERIYLPIDDTCWFIHDGNTNATIDDVVAWMPLPESYRGES